MNKFIVHCIIFNILALIIIFIKTRPYEHRLYEDIRVELQYADSINLYDSILTTTLSGFEFTTYSNTISY